MKIDAEKCISCLECIDFCPVGAILEEDHGVEIVQNECVECSVCLKSEICPTEAFYMPEESLKFPRAIRAEFSDPTVSHSTINIKGRGTEEMKTNDVTGRYKKGEYGIIFEFGRPGIGTRIAEIEKATKALCSLNIEIEKDNPVYGLIADPETGIFKPEVANEKVLSAILEFKIKDNQLEDIVNTLIPVLKQVKTVVTWGLITRFEDDRTLPVRKRLKKLGVSIRPNAKINLGMGRPLINE